MWHTVEHHGIKSASYGDVLAEFQLAIHVSPQDGGLIFCCFNAHLAVASDIRVQSHDYPSLNFQNSGELTCIQTAAEDGPAGVDHRLLVKPEAQLNVFVDKANRINYQYLSLLDY